MRFPKLRRWLRYKLNSLRTKKTQPFDVALAFQSAEAFDEVARLLHRAAMQGHTYILPIAIVTNASFALETYLKCLVALEGGVFLRGHDTWKLFRKLKRKTQTALCAYHENYIKGKPEFEAAKKKGIKVDLDSLLKRGRNAFVDFRYAYETIPAGRDWGVGGLNQALREEILKIHPEWKIDR
jgi:hypothetical protein